MAKIELSKVVGKLDSFLIHLISPALKVGALESTGFVILNAARIEATKMNREFWARSCPGQALKYAMSSG
jgi:hypothetical protein